MPAIPQGGLTPAIDTIGIVAGGGALPGQVLQACERQGIKTFVIAFDGQTDPAILTGRRYLLTRLGAAGRIINTLKSQGISDLAFIGAVRRPSLREMRPDMRALRFFARLVTRAIGDDTLLRAIKAELEREGFRLHAVQDLAGELLAGPGPLGAHVPGAVDADDIKRGIDILRATGGLDIGQAVVVQEGLVLGLEAAEGTDDLIRRCGILKRAGRGPVLVKLSKPGQAHDLDLPTIGPDTVRNAAAAGFSGIVIESGRTLIPQADRVAELADQFKIFVTGIDTAA